jgi:hypothetical protein
MFMSIALSKKSTASDQPSAARFATGSLRMRLPVAAKIALVSPSRVLFDGHAFRPETRPSYRSGAHFGSLYF